MEKLKYNGKTYKIGQRVRINSGSNNLSKNGKTGVIKSFLFDGKETSLKGFMDIDLEDGEYAHVYDEIYGKHDVDILDEKVYTIQDLADGKVIATPSDSDALILPKGDYTIAEPKKEEVVSKPTETQYLKRFPSGAVRSDSRGKVRIDFVSPYALKLIAEHFSRNSDDFNGFEEFGTNYFKGIEPKDILPSLSRHKIDFDIALLENNKELIKEELTATACNCIMALHQIVMEEKGLYKKIYDKTEIIKK